MKKILGLVVIVGILVITAHATDNFSDNITVPYTFSSGETISSSKMNKNFDKIFEELNKIRKYIFSNGKIIAEFLSFKDSYAIGELVTGHLIRINLADGSYYQIDGSMNMLYFTSNDCSGDIYINSGSLLPNEVFNLNYYDQVISQIINAPYITSQEYYSIIYKSSAWRTTDYQSNGVYGSCSKNSDTDWETSTFKIIPNDSLITGISTNAQETPISIKNK